MPTQPVASGDRPFKIDPAVGVCSPDVFHRLPHPIAERPPIDRPDRGLQR
jgi:hypothetical protein